MPRLRNQPKRKLIRQEYLSSDDSDCYFNTSLKNGNHASNKNRKTVFKYKDSSDDSDYEGILKKKELKEKKKRKTKHSSNSLNSGAPYNKKCSKTIEVLDSDNEDIEYDIKEAYKQDIENKVSSFFKQFNSDDDDDFKSISVPKVEHKQNLTSKKYNKDMYVLTSDTETEADVKPSTSTCNLVNNVVENNKATEMKPALKTTCSEDLFSFVEDIIEQNDVIKAGVEKVKGALIPSFEDLMKKTNEILSSTTSVIGNIASKPKEPEVQTVVIEKKGPNCPVCLETLDGDSKVMVTVCGHMFCESCIKRVVQTIKKCPTCRNVITDKKYHPIYL
ncbi:uncharacterized protein LOC143203068 isoform X1 [Rhynchophorus ferrugineus]|uniref:uncharacterized protein LOC143203068 isoform X1 n=1 Tax=Rhynchophorus ferrugineus TaxID=354439 RepID=UPI003FCD5712